MPYLNEIMGFFVIEDRIAQMQPSLVTEAHKEELWELALYSITEAINRHFVSLNKDMNNYLKFHRAILQKSNWFLQ